MPLCGAGGCLKRRPDPDDARRASGEHTLLSFERPALSPRGRFDGLQAREPRSFPDLENCTEGQREQIARLTASQTGSSEPATCRDHRQDSKGTRWMPWHQEPMKGVDDCDKPR